MRNRPPILIDTATTAEPARQEYLFSAGLGHRYGLDIGVIFLIKLPLLLLLWLLVIRPFVQSPASIGRSITRIYSSSTSS